mmetsp:Transcript_43486/g.93147  ORF Transcript_43486/g.93147 Transcript_43486/m.93147 type:complete len:407 (+) Transcript_43486:39-1259(+)
MLRSNMKRRSQRGLAEASLLALALLAPTDASPTIISDKGGGAGNFLELAAKETERTGPTTFFCITSFAPGTSEMALLSAQEDKKVGVFACDAHMVFSSAPPPGLPGSEDSGEDAGGAALVERVWQVVFADKRYENFDWTVRVDMDTILLPNRLGFIADMVCGADTGKECSPMYIEGIRGSSSQPVEVISSKGMKYLAENNKACEAAGLDGDKQGAKGSWYFTPCLKALGVKNYLDAGLVVNVGKSSSGQVDTQYCDSVHAAFQPMTDWDTITRCMEKAGHIRPDEDKRLEEEVTGKSSIILGAIGFFIGALLATLATHLYVASRRPRQAELAMTVTAQQEVDDGKGVETTFAASGSPDKERTFSTASGHLRGAFRPLPGKDEAADAKGSADDTARKPSADAKSEKK